MSQHLGNLFTAELTPLAWETLDGTGPVDTGSRRIGTLAGANIGIWEAGEGLIGGVTKDEIFIVLEGHAEITFEDTLEVIEIGPGDVVRLNAGQRNRWRTHDRLRKFSVSVPPAG